MIPDIGPSGCRYKPRGIYVSPGTGSTLAGPPRRLLPLASRESVLRINGSGSCIQGNRSDTVASRGFGPNRADSRPCGSAHWSGFWTAPPAVTPGTSLGAETGADSYKLDEHDRIEAAGLPWRSPFGRKVDALSR